MILSLKPTRFIIIGLDWIGMHQTPLISMETSWKLQNYKGRQVREGVTGAVVSSSSSRGHDSRASNFYQFDPFFLVFYFVQN